MEIIFPEDQIRVLLQSFPPNQSNLGLNGSLKRPGDFLTRITPSKTARICGGSSKSTPGRLSRDTTPGRSGGDRYIPNRSAMDMEASYHKLCRETNNSVDEEMMSPSRRKYQKMLKENLNIAEGKSSRVLSFSTKATTPSKNCEKMLFTRSPGPNTPYKKFIRHIPQTAERILDAPEILDDFYLNLVDWSENNQVAVALASSVWIWNADTGTPKELFTLEDGEYVTSVKWIAEGGHNLAVGTSDACLQIWDVAQMKLLRMMTGHESRVSSLSWNQYILSSGSRTGTILHSDVRVPDHLVSRSEHHTQEVCGLTWSDDGKYLASGGNDNIVCVWSSRGGQLFANPSPHLVLSEHQAAVRALAWCPWQSGVLATGGGTNDRTIKIWNVNNGNLLSNLDTKSQVCGLLWNETYKELVSSHGYPSYRINIWKYPSLTKVADLIGHSGRILQLNLSPDTETLLSTGADETLRLWHCFPIDESKNREVRGRQPYSAFKAHLIR